MRPEQAHVIVWETERSYGNPSAIAAAVGRAIDALGLPGDFVRPGDSVVLKPNWIKEHDERYAGPGHWEHVVTHPAVIEAVVGWVAPRLGGAGRITICDAPQTDSSFALLRRWCGLDELVARCEAAFPGVEFRLLDLRPEEWHSVDGVTVARRPLPGDPAGAVHIRLDGDSEFVGFHGLGSLYGASYDMQETNERHHGARHEYLLCRTPVDADVFINLPKLKCHKKVGLTCALKNIVGINANKNWLPHYTEGTPGLGGDQFSAETRKARLEHAWMGALKQFLAGRRALSALFVPIKKMGRVFFGDTSTVVRSGNWHGNDTCWRMVIDLNKCLFRFDGSGAPRREPLRYLALVDGIVGGEGNGPTAPDPKPSGVIVAGTNPLAVDVVCARIMGFDPGKIRMLTGAFASARRPIASFAHDEIRVASNAPRWNKPLQSWTLRDVLRFRPHFGWVGAIEYEE